MDYFMVPSWQFPGWARVNHKISGMCRFSLRENLFFFFSCLYRSLPFFYPLNSSHSIYYNKSLYNENCCLCKISGNLSHMVPGQFATWTLILLCYYLIKLWHMKLSSNPLIVNLQLSKYSSLHFSTEKDLFQTLYKL